MEFRFNLKKSHVFAIIGMIFFVGMVIAYGSTQPPSVMGHTTGELFIQGLGAQGISDQLFNPVFGWMHQQVTAHDARLISLENPAWTPITPINGGPLCWPNAGGQCNPGITGTSIPTSQIPITAKEVLVYAWVSRGSGGGGGGQFSFDIYTQQGSTKYIQKLRAYDNSNSAWAVNSDNFWLPVTSDGQIYIQLPSTLNGNFNTGIEFLGYR